MRNLANKFKKELLYVGLPLIIGLSGLEAHGQNLIDLSNKEKFIYTAPKINDSLNKKTRLRKKQDKVTENIMTYISCKRNLTFEERQEILKQSQNKYLRKLAKDSTKSLEYFPILNELDTSSYSYLLELFVNNGNPKIRVKDFFESKLTDYYNPLTNTISITVYQSKFHSSELSKYFKDPAAVYLNNCLMELPHAIQFRKKPLRTMSKVISSFARILIEAIKSGSYSYSLMYDNEKSFEYEAHEVISPKIQEDYSNYLNGIEKR